MQPILVHRLWFRSYDRLFVTNTANSIPLFSGVLASRCLANGFLLVHCYSGYQVVFTETLPSKQWLEHLIQTPL
jgi:hypothetical protein